MSLYGLFSRTHTWGIAATGLIPLWYTLGTQGIKENTEVNIKICAFVSPNLPSLIFIKQIKFYFTGKLLHWVTGFRDDLH